MSFLSLGFTIFKVLVFSLTWTNLVVAKWLQHIQVSCSNKMMSTVEWRASCFSGEEIFIGQDWIPCLYLSLARGYKTITCLAGLFRMQWMFVGQLPWQPFPSFIVSSQDNLKILENKYGNGKHRALAMKSGYLDSFMPNFSTFWFDITLGISIHLVFFGKHCWI